MIAAPWTNSKTISFDKQVQGQKATWHEFSKKRKEIKYKSLFAEIYSCFLGNLFCDLIDVGWDSRIKGWVIHSCSLTCLAIKKLKRNCLKPKAFFASSQAQQDVRLEFLSKVQKYFNILIYFWEYFLLIFYRVLVLKFLSHGSKLPEICCQKITILILPFKLKMHLHIDLKIKWKKILFMFMKITAWNTMQASNTSCCFIL